MSEPHVNYLAVLVAAVAGFALGGLWYSPMLFAKPWTAALGKKPEELGSPAQGMIVAFISSLITALAIALMLSKIPAVTWMGGLKVGALAGIGIFGVTAYSDAKFTGASPTVVAIGLTYRALMMIVMGLILAVWQ